MRGKSQTKQTLSDARESTNWRVLCQGPHMVIMSHMVITEKRLAIEVQPMIGAEKPPEVERGRFCVLSANFEAHGHMESCPGYELHRMEKRQCHIKMNSESESARLLREL